MEVTTGERPRCSEKEREPSKRNRKRPRDEEEDCYREVTGTQGEGDRPVVVQRTSVETLETED